ncbi:hypothetical protein VP1G_09158 [Cytospora mali]|uniref:Uncharacterized protein n=1 Tax=Cytospora mali TaxID=578113 RepID=A0A194VE15_CYTMA|nr:hypothetical protein VP1G_09158 [Valsa mali var. pyri (nom. inval.)]
MSTNHIDDTPRAFLEAIPEQKTPDLTTDNVSHVLRLLHLPELRLGCFSHEVSSKVLTAMQGCFGDNDDEFTNFLSLPKWICQAHQATKAAEKELLDTFSALVDAENKLDEFPEKLDYDDGDVNDNDDDDDHDPDARGEERFRQELPRLNSLTLTMREAHVLAAEGREERADLVLEYLEAWLKILAASSVRDVVHKDYHAAKDTHMVREAALAEAYWLYDTCPHYEEDWDEELVWAFILDGRTALDLLISRGVIIVGGMGMIEA